MSRNSFPLKPLYNNAGAMVVQNITTGAASVQATNPVSAQTYGVQLSCTSDCWVVFSNTSAGAVATASNSFLLKASDPSLHIGISPNQYIAALQRTAAGTLNILELTH